MKGRHCSFRLNIIKQILIESRSPVLEAPPPVNGDTLGAGRHQAAVLTQLGLLGPAVEAGGGVHAGHALLRAHAEVLLSVCCGVNTRH